MRSAIPVAPEGACPSEPAPPRQAPPATGRTPAHLDAFDGAEPDEMSART
ncbi:hypothetical protein SAMN05216223_109295 [Actinacidiphila yanglinensis]|uniref:Uncharacterized protein n=1 Tax=Actinacidiphila yanglinensis TaxID=310779 RepID=A0A1H6CQH8_9ACTN|nr:hypothetical protein SAMN05216223_109295 [Actinacidiphila yanglinensis]